MRGRCERISRTMPRSADRAVVATDLGSLAPYPARAKIVLACIATAASQRFKLQKPHRVP